MMFKKVFVIILILGSYVYVAYNTGYAGDKSYKENSNPYFIKVSDTYRDESWIDTRSITGIYKYPVFIKKDSEYLDDRTNERKKYTEDKIIWEVSYIGTGVVAVYDSEEEANEHIQDALYMSNINLRL